MNKIILLAASCVVLAGCGAATAPGTVPTSSNKITVIEEFGALDALSGIALGTVNNPAEKGVSGGVVTAMKAALVAGLQQEGLLIGDSRPQSGVLTLEVLDVMKSSSDTTVTVRMLVENRHNWAVLGDAEVVGRGDVGDVRGAALSAVDTILAIVIAKMKPEEG